MGVWSGESNVYTSLFANLCENLCVKTCVGACSWKPVCENLFGNLCGNLNGNLYSGPESVYPYPNHNENLMEICVSFCVVIYNMFGPSSFHEGFHQGLPEGFNEGVQERVRFGVQRWTPKHVPLEVPWIAATGVNTAWSACVVSPNKVQIHHLSMAPKLVCLNPPHKCANKQ